MSILAWLTENRTPRQTIAKNTFWLAAGQVGSRLLRAAIVIYAARTLGAGSWGAFAYALGIVTFLTVFSDIGINGIITREAARSPALRDRYLASAFALKLVLIALLTAAAALTLPYLTKIAEARALLPILLFVFAFDTLRDLGSAFARALEQMQIEALAGILTNAAIVFLGFLFLALAPTSAALAWGYVLGSASGAILIAFALRKHLRRLRGAFDPRLWRQIMRTAWPFGLLAMMGAVMLNTDIVMLGWLRSPQEVGYYSAAQKIVQLLYVLPTFFASSMFPLLTRLAREDALAARTFLEKSVAGVLMLAAPLAALGAAFGGTIIKTLFGAAYAPAAPAFSILMLTLILTYPSILIGNAIFAYRRERAFVSFVLLAVTLNVAWNFALIPRFGIAGAAGATLATQLMADTLIWYRMKRVNGFTILRGARALFTR